MSNAMSEAAAQRLRPAARTSATSFAFALEVSIVALLLAASSAPTPLYPLYQDQWGLTPLTITVVFSAYALALLVALLTVGGLSDHLGRRPVLMGALALEVVAMVLLASADGAGALVAARVLQGAATGAATSAAGAALLDLDDPRRPGRSALANSIAPVAGMATGVLASTLLILFAPAPTTTVYVVLAVLFAAQAIAVARTPETAHPHPGALRSLRPRLAVPPAARRTLLAAGAGIAAVWALGGFYSSLGPALVRLVDPGAPDAFAGTVFLTVSATAALTVRVLRGTAPSVAVSGGALLVAPSAALSLLGLYGAGPAAVQAGAALAGVAFGAVSQGALRMLLAALDDGDRATTLAAYYVLCYLAMSLPAVAAGAGTQQVGLRTVSAVYAASTALLAVVAAVALAVFGRKASRSPAHRNDRADGIDPNYPSHYNY
ncbi:MFS transporter [Kitasatospora purpeofusca]|uniref:MFS transporter n=1 Tax=Kitasatospora purpeofusca TaxID=67352 RepID=UPI0036A05492